jgi:hypothetical protein
MPDPSLQGTALRYAAADLTPAEAGAFEARLADDQDAREALAEAVRLSAAAIGQKPPTPDPFVRTALRLRLARRGSRWHPVIWTGFGATAVALSTLIGLGLAQREPVELAPSGNTPRSGLAEHPSGEHSLGQSGAAAAPQPHDPTPVVSAEVPDSLPGGEVNRSVAEIWADLSTPEHVEKARDDELRWRHHVRAMSHPQHPPAIARTTAVDEP